MLVFLRDRLPGPFWTFSKWWLMIVVIFWIMVYKLSQQTVHLPEFVYVNF